MPHLRRHLSTSPGPHADGSTSPGRTSCSATSPRWRAGHEKPWRTMRPGCPPCRGTRARRFSGRSWLHLPPPMRRCTSPRKQNSGVRRHNGCLGISLRPSGKAHCRLASGNRELCANFEQADRTQSAPSVQGSVELGASRYGGQPSMTLAWRACQPKPRAGGAFGGGWRRELGVCRREGG